MFDEYEEDDLEIIEDGEEGLPEVAQGFKDWYADNMHWAHTEQIDGEYVIMMPAFDYDVQNDEFLDVDIEKAYCIWKGALSTVEQE